MEIAFESTAEDQQAHLQAVAVMPAWKQWAIYYSSFFVLAGPAFVPYFLTAQYVAGTIFLALFSALWLWMAYCAAWPKPSTEHGTVCIRLQPDYLEEREPNVLTRIAWGMVESIQTHDLYLHIRLRTKWCICIPRRAFADEAELARFIEVAEHYRQAAIGQPLVKLPLDDDEIYPPWAKAASLSIGFDIEAYELAHVRNGIRRGKRPHMYASVLSVLTWLALALIAPLLGMVHYWAGADSTVPLPTFICCLMYLSSFLWFASATYASMLIVQWLDQRWISPLMLASHRLTIAPQGYVSSALHATACIRWDFVGMIEQNEEFIGFKNQDQQLITFIPKRAFADPTAAADFADEALRWWEEANQTGVRTPAEEIIHAEAIDGENPYRSPRA